MEGGKRSRRRKAVEYRLLKLYEAAREDGRKPDPGFDLYQHGAKDGFDKAFTTILELVNPTDLASHVRPQYVFGYYDGLVAALHHWLDQLEKDRLVSEPDDD